MSAFVILQNDDGSVEKILRDGEPYDKGLQLEPPHQIVSTYFKIARNNLDGMRSREESDARRALGLQAFLMSLSGIEAFTNVFFHLVSREKGDEALLKACSNQGPLVKRLEACLVLAFNEPLPGQKELLERIGDLYRFRNEIVHPRWVPVSMAMPGIMIDGLCQNFQVTCEDFSFCEQAFWQCISLIAEIGKANGDKTIEGICFHWAGIYGLTDEQLAAMLSVKRDDGGK